MARAVELLTGSSRPCYSGILDDRPVAEKRSVTAPADRPYLTLAVIAGPNRGALYHVADHQVFLVGRSPSAHCILPEDDRFVSRHHFLIEINPPQCRLVDLESHNGTFVNGKRTRLTDLRDGDEIQIGATRLRVSLMAGTQQTPDAAAWQLPGKDTEPLPARIQQLFVEHWHAGSRRRLEPYLERWPELHADADGLVELIYCEYLLREQRGEKLRTEEFVERFPAVAAAVRRQLEMHALFASHEMSAATGTRETESVATALPRVPGYRLRLCLGTGALGTVYRGEDDSGLAVVVKRLDNSRADDDAAVVRFREQFLAPAALRLDLWALPLAVLVKAGSIWAVSAYVPGDDLERYIERVGPMPPTKAIALLTPLAHDLHRAHDRGCWHGDLKPRNLIRDEAGVVRVTDGGLQRAFQATAREGLSLLQAGGGLHGFVAPEQVQADQPIGPATDQYALAAVAVWLLTAQPVFAATTMATLLRDILQTAPPAVAALPPALGAVLKKALRKQPAERYPSMSAFAKALDAAR